MSKQEPNMNGLACYSHSGESDVGGQGSIMDSAYETNSIKTLSETGTDTVDETNRFNENETINISTQGNSTDMEPRKKGKTRILWRKRYLEETELLRKENEKVLKEKEQMENELNIIKKKMAEMKEYNEVNNSNKKIFENEYTKEIENDNIQQKKKIEQMQISYKLLLEGLKAQNEKEKGTAKEMEFKVTLLSEQLANREIHLGKVQDIIDRKNEWINFWENGYKKLDEKLTEVNKDKLKNEESLVKNLNKVKEENNIQKQQLSAKQEEIKLLCENLSNLNATEIQIVNREKVLHSLKGPCPNGVKIDLGGLLEGHSSKYDDARFEYLKIIRVLKIEKEEVENELARLKLGVQDQLNNKQNELNAKGGKNGKMQRYLNHLKKEYDDLENDYQSLLNDFKTKTDFLKEQISSKEESCINERQKHTLLQQKNWYLDNQLKTAMNINEIKEIAYEKLREDNLVDKAEIDSLKFKLYGNLRNTVNEFYKIDQEELENVEKWKNEAKHWKKKLEEKCSELLIERKRFEDMIINHKRDKKILQNQAENFYDEMENLKIDQQEKLDIIMMLRNKLEEQINSNLVNKENEQKSGFTETVEEFHNLTELFVETENLSDLFVFTGDPSDIESEENEDLELGNYRETANLEKELRILNNKLNLTSFNSYEYNDLIISIMKKQRELNDPLYEPSVLEKEENLKNLENFLLKSNGLPNVLDENVQVYSIPSISSVSNSDELLEICIK